MPLNNKGVLKKAILNPETVDFSQFASTNFEAKSDTRTCCSFITTIKDVTIFEKINF